MKIAPTRLPITIATIADQNGCENTVVARAPVTIVRTMMLEPNQMVNRSRALPCRSASGIGCMVASSIRCGCSLCVVTALILCAGPFTRQRPASRTPRLCDRTRFSNTVSSVTELSRYISPAFSEALHLFNRCTNVGKGYLSFRCRTTATTICYLLVLARDSEHCVNRSGGRMSSQEIEVLVVGAGQAGVAMSEHLNGYGVPHLVVERHRIAERWRSERWDSLVANGPAWHDRFPRLEFAGIAPDDFASKEQVADYFVAYAEKIGAPIRCGVEVTSVRKNAGRPGFRVETSDGVIEARYVVAATGPFQRPVIPAIIPDGAGLLKIHSSSY